jgi:pimeloyl-ACP methyl ester carboxylesterase
LGFEPAIAATALLAFVAVTLWRAGRTERRVAAACPPRGRLIATPGGVVHAVQLGAGPDLVLIHGAGSNLNDFPAALLEPLAAQFRITLFDRPGLGHSQPLAGAQDPEAQAAQLAEAAKALGLHRPVVLGHSYGALVALAWALGCAQLPVAPSALVLVSGAMMPAALGLHGIRAMIATRAGRAIAAPLGAAWTSRFAMKHFLRIAFSPQPVPASYAHDLGIRLILRRPSARANAAQAAGIRHAAARLSAAYPGLQLPVEVLHGTADAVVPHAPHAVALSAMLPHAHLTLLPGIGHMPHHAAPQAVIAATLRAAALALPA